LSAEALGMRSDVRLASPKFSSLTPFRVMMMLGGFEVAMRHAFFVSCLQSLSDLPSHLQSLFH